MFYNAIRLSILAAIFVVGCAPRLPFDGSLAVLPYDLRSDGRIVIEVQVNDRGPYRFAIDTAATSSALFASVIGELALEPVPGVSEIVHGAVATGNFPVVDIDHLQIGDETWANVRLIALTDTFGNTTAIDGLLGADFLRRYAVGFSTQDRSVRLYRPATIGNRSYRGWNSIHIEPIRFGDTREPLRYLEIELVGRSVPALLDLGAGFNILNPSAARSLRLTTRRPEQAGEFAGAVGNEPVLAQLSSQDLRTGNVSWVDETFLIADLEIFDTLEATDSPLAILGSGLFNQRDFIIDYARDRLLIKDSMSEYNE